MAEKSKAFSNLQNQRALPRLLSSARINFSPSTWRWLIGCTLVVLMTFAPASPVTAQASITWDDLQSQTTELRNPYEHLSTDQTYRLSSLYKLREWAKEEQLPPDSFEVQEIERLEQSFVEEGLNTDELLVHAEEARAYCQSRYQVKNSD